MQSLLGQSGDFDIKFGNFILLIYDLESDFP